MAALSPVDRGTGPRSGEGVVVTPLSYGGSTGPAGIAARAAPPPARGRNSEVAVLAAVPSATLLGVQGHAVRVEVHVSSGLPGFTVVGLPDVSCRESRDRVRAAVLTSGFKWNLDRVTVNLAPTNLRKVGSGLDLAIAVALLAASEQLDAALLDGLAFLGELGLDGAVRHVVGTLPLCEAVGRHRPVVPLDDLREATLVRSDALGASDLAQLVRSLRGEEPWPVDPPTRRAAGLPAHEPDLSQVQGHAVARRALEVAAAGGHHLLMVGPPGAGKTMLAERLPGLLPDLDDEAALDVSRVHSAAGALHDRPELLRRPPFRSPHHTASLVALVGGGSSVLRPGEISLASGGVLFLDELGEFPAAHLDALRQPLESGEIRVARAAVGATLPARFLLVAATNPCPCGAGVVGRCRCSPGQVARYLRRLSGPLLDRFDLGLWVQPPDAAEVFGAGPPGESSARVRDRVASARDRARSRGVPVNRRLSGEALERAAPLTDAGLHVLRERIDRGSLTMRGAQRVRAVALTLMDLDGRSGPIGPADLQVALMLRSQDDVLGVAA